MIRSQSGKEWNDDESENSGEQDCAAAANFVGEGADQQGAYDDPDPVDSVDDPDEKLGMLAPIFQTNNFEV
ncbi:hypothetical protein SGCOL_011882 [Colletotrichum sp. CLE4]